MDTYQHLPSLSPSKITQYLKTRKSKSRGGAKTRDIKSSAAQEEKESVYLTPDSSPASVDNENQDITSPGILTDTNESNVNSNQSAVSNDIRSDLQKVFHSPERKTSTDYKDTCENFLSCRSPSIDQSPKLENAEPGQVAAEISNNASVADLPSADSPCVPRSKVRKSKKIGGHTSATGGSDPVKPKSGRRKKIVATPQSNAITDYFPIRRSNRQTKSEVDKEKQLALEQMILNKCENGLKIQDFLGKGRGIVATKDFDRNDFVVEYVGDLLDVAVAREKEQTYAKDPSIGSYMYFFKCEGKQYCLDATAESGRLGRLLNHSRDGNCMTRSLMLNGIPRLILVAKRNITAGEELCYDYGDRSKEALEAHPWLKL